MNVYTTISGETLRYEDPPANVAKYLKRLLGAVDDPSIGVDAMISLIYSVENPLLDTQMVPGRAMVTPAVFANPVYQVMRDCEYRKRAALGLYDVEAIRAAHSVSVQEAARAIGLTEAAIRAAIKAKRLAAIPINGQWWMRPDAVASYKVSARGPKRAAGAQVAPADPARAAHAVQVRMGPDASYGYNLVAFVEPGEIAREENGFGQFPPDWTRALIRMTSKTGVRVFEIEPTESASLIEHGKMFVRGAFRIVAKHNNTREANEVWKAWKGKEAERV